MVSVTERVKTFFLSPLQLETRGGRARACWMVSVTERVKTLFFSPLQLKDAQQPASKPLGAWAPSPWGPGPQAFEGPWTQPKQCWS